MGVIVGWVAAVRGEERVKWGKDNTGKKTRWATLKEDPCSGRTEGVKAHFLFHWRKNNHCRWTAGRGRQLLLAALPKYTSMSASSCGGSRGWVPKQQHLKHQLQFNNCFKCWFKAFGHQGHKGPQLHLHGSWPSGQFGYCDWPTESTYSCIWNYASRIPASSLALPLHRGDL